MNDEIKLSKSEIIGICEFLKIHHFENSYLLLDYITNLQQENKEFQLELSGYRNAILKNDNLLGLQQRIDKAIEYLNESNRDEFDYSITHLLEILGGDEE